MRTDVEEDTARESAAVPLVLIALGLQPDELEALRRQGHVTRERRGTRVIAKLRWRQRGQQRVIYLGSDHRQAAAIHAALNALRWPLRFKQRLKARAAQVSKILRSIKPRLAQVADQAGMHFHGRRLRRRRTGNRSLITETSKTG